MIKKSYQEILLEPASQAMIDYMYHITAYMESFNIFFFGICLKQTHTMQYQNG